MTSLLEIIYSVPINLVLEQKDLLTMVPLMISIAVLRPI